MRLTREESFSKKKRLSEDVVVALNTVSAHLLAEKKAVENINEIIAEELGALPSTSLRSCLVGESLSLQMTVYALDEVTRRVRERMKTIPDAGDWTQ